MQTNTGGQLCTRAEADLWLLANRQPNSALRQRLFGPMLPISDVMNFLVKMHIKLFEDNALGVLHHRTNIVSACAPEVYDKVGVLWRDLSLTNLKSL